MMERHKQMMWTTAGTENGRSLQYRVTDCCIEKRIIDQYGNIERETIEELANPRHRDTVRAYVEQIPRSYSSRPSRHRSILRGGRYRSHTRTMRRGKSRRARR